MKRRAFPAGALFLGDWPPPPLLLFAAGAFMLKPAFTGGMGGTCRPSLAGGTDGTGEECCSPLYGHLAVGILAAGFRAVNNEFVDGIDAITKMFPDPGKLILGETEFIDWYAQGNLGVYLINILSAWSA